MKELTFEMIEPYINKNEDKNYVIHCNTKEKTEKLFKVLNPFDKKLNSWYTYKENTCYEIFYFCNKINWYYNNKGYFLKNYSTIIEFDDLFKEKENKMNIENGYIEFNGNRVELTKEQMEKLFGKDNPYEYKGDENFYHTNENFEIYVRRSAIIKEDSNGYKTGNYCRDKKLKVQDTLHDLLRSKLRQFSMLNGGLDINWNNDASKYYIYYSNKGYTGYDVNNNSYYKQDSIYFIDKETAQRAIDEIIVPFEKEYPEFVW